MDPTCPTLVVKKDQEFCSRGEQVPDDSGDTAALALCYRLLDNSEILYIATKQKAFWN